MRGPNAKTCCMVTENPNSTMLCATASGSKISVRPQRIGFSMAWKDSDDDPQHQSKHQRADAVAISAVSKKPPMVNRTHNPRLWHNAFLYYLMELRYALN